MQAKGIAGAAAGRGAFGGSREMVAQTELGRGMLAEVGGKLGAQLTKCGV